MSEEPESVAPEPTPATLHAPVVLVDSPEDFLRALDDLESGEGPLAIDAERASGFRYTNQAYLVQLFRTGCANYLIDPLGVPDLGAISTRLGDLEWIIHAAHQDLSCLREVGINPTTLFDTELGARLAGLPRVGLQGVVEDLMGMSLAKEHSAADWSTRPLPDSWLTYAALDVELLPRVRDHIHALLLEQGKMDIAREEFAAALLAPEPTPRAEPWRRLSGLHQVRGGRALAIAKSLWEARDAYARETNTAPGRLVPDRSVVAAVLANPSSKSELAGLKAFHGRASRQQLDRWWQAIEAGRTATELPEARAASEGPPPPRIWADRNPEAAQRFTRAKEALSELSEEITIPSENILTPDFLRRVCWAPPQPLSEEGIDGALAELGARPWQRVAVASILLGAFVSKDQ
jgi:ribonuclease D